MRMSIRLLHFAGEWKMWLPQVNPAGAVLVTASPTTVIILTSLLILSLAGLALSWWSHRRFLATILQKVDSIRTASPTRNAGDSGDLEKKLSAGMGALVDRVGREQQELGVISAQLRALLSQLRDPVIITDEQMRVTLCNDRAQEVFPGGGKTRTGDPFTDFLSQVPVLELISVARRENRPVREQVKLIMSGRVRTVDLGIAPVMLGARRQGMLLVIEDQTEMIQNIQMKTDFVANASHELRTPLASIKAAVDTITDAGLSDEQTLGRCIAIIDGHVLRLQLLVRDLLDLSRTEDPRSVVRMEPIDIADLRRMILEMFGHLAAQKQVELRFGIVSPSSPIRGDERLVMLILKNLVDNSLKFTTTGFVDIRIHHDAGAVNLEVEDTGCGIPPEERHRVFERFYTVNRSRGGADRGTGLGLAIVKHAVAAMGGTVALESEPGKGTTVRCTWPESRK